ncbi:hypothetical protein EV284_6356 [Streptomyces sp. BK022]|uniref:hypothetical protein n=1 Tax=Streptomyces sp. BK022 TaxID=2512123 RepID=UPI001028FD78|nr:hypothetical protein [Streptomyces sp. BK022]RZU28190.1 hypothetical protein EV284_6356 [Streptomyces sp. BK022]
MSHDVTDDGTANMPPALQLDERALLGALARMVREGQDKTVFGPLVDDPLGALVDAYEKHGQTGVVIKAGDEIVGTYTVNKTQPKIVFDPDPAKVAELDAYAERHEGTEVVIRRRQSWDKALLRYAERDEETGRFFDKRNGEEIPGLMYEPGGQATGTVTFTWEKKEVGQNRLLRAWQRGEYDHLLRGTPQLMPPPQPSAEDAQN